MELADRHLQSADCVWAEIDDILWRGTSLNKGKCDFHSCEVIMMLKKFNTFAALSDRTSDIFMSRTRQILQWLLEPILINNIFLVITRYEHLVHMHRKSTSIFDHMKQLINSSIDVSGFPWVDFKPTRHHPVTTIAQIYLFCYRENRPRLTLRSIVSLSYSDITHAKWLDHDVNAYCKFCELIISAIIYCLNENIVMVRAESRDEPRVVAHIAKRKCPGDSSDFTNVLGSIINDDIPSTAIPKI